MKDNMELNKIICGDCLEVLKTLPDESVNCCITSPPYWGLRDYGVDGQLGLEKTPEEYVAHIVEVLREVRRVLRNDGTCWLNLGDSYAGSMKGANGDGTWQDRSNCKQGTNIGALNIPPQKAKDIGLKPKDLVGIPWLVAFALRADGWYLRQDIIWAKPNPMPESVTDRCTKSHEYVFLLAKSQKYYYDKDAIAEPSETFENRPSGVERNREYGYDSKENLYPEAYRKNIVGNISERGITRTTEGLNLKTQAEKTKETRNRRSVWTVTTKPFSEAHFATFPEALIEPMVLAGCPEGGIILDPFMGAGTTGMVAKKNYRSFIGIELNQKYIDIATNRINGTLVNRRLFQ
jgi:DNA modification methylase